MPGKRNGDSGKAWSVAAFEAVGGEGGAARIIPAMTVGCTIGGVEISALVEAGTFSTSFMDSDGGRIADVVSSLAGC